MKFLKIATVALSAFFSTAVFAHTDEYLDTISGAHGGQLRMAGPSHYEMVVTPTALQIYVTDHAGKPTAVEGASGNATVLSGNQKQQIELHPKGENLLEGGGSFTPDQPVKAVVKVQLAGQEARQTLFDSSRHHPADEHHGH